MAIVHAAAVALLGLLLVELLLIRLDKLPFTCSYYPGASKTRTLWPFYLIAFINYCYTSTALELSAICCADWSNTSMVRRVSSIPAACCALDASCDRAAATSSCDR